MSIEMKVRETDTDVVSMKPTEGRKDAIEVNENVLILWSEDGADHHLKSTIQQYFF